METKAEDIAILPNKEELNKKLKVTLKNIDKKLKNIGVNTLEDPYQTGGHFKYNELDANTINICTTSDLIYLVKALSLMKSVKENYENTMGDMFIKEYPVCTWVNISIDKWIHDLENRIKIVSNQFLIDKLNAAKKDLEQYLSQDEKLYSTLIKVQELSKL